MSEGNKLALIVACDRYSDPKLKELKAPSQDAERFARILEDKKIGDFRVTTLINQSHDTITTKVNRFLQSCDRDDTVLLYFSCHGIKDTDGELYFATITTDRTLLLATGIHSNFVNKLLDRCRAQQKVVLLDCCYSGAFEKGRIVRAHSQVNATQFFGRGNVIITASDSMQYAFEGDEIESLRKGGGSYFTDALVKGLETGDADVNKDGRITYSELYEYIHDYVRKITPDQTPTLNARGVEGDFIIFNNPNYTSGSVLPKRKQTRRKEGAMNDERPDLVLEFIKKARMLLEEEQYDDAITIFDSILIMRKGHIEALNGKGMALCKQKKYEEALECFNEVLKTKPRHPEASTYVGIITDRKSKEYKEEEKASAGTREKDTELEKQTEDKVKKALTDSTQIPAELIKKGDSFYENGNYQDAILCYDQALKIEPLSEKAWHNKGLALDSLGRYEEAIRQFDKAIEINPNNANVWLDKGVALENLGSPDEAIKCYEKALGITPRNANAWYNKGSILDRKGDYKQALSCFEEAFKINPNSQIYQDNIRIELGKLGRTDDSQQHLGQQVLGADPRNPYNDPTLPYYNPSLDKKKDDDSQYIQKHIQHYPVEHLSEDKSTNRYSKDANYWYNEGLTFESIDRYKKAIACYDQAIKLKPEYTMAWYNKGNSLYRLNRNEEAIACYEKVIELDQDSAKAWNNKGNALYSLNKNKEAIACYEKAIQLDPKLAVAWYNKGKAISDLGEKNAAIDCFEKAKELGYKD